MEVLTEAQSYSTRKVEARRKKIARRNLNQRIFLAILIFVIFLLGSVIYSSHLPIPIAKTIEVEKGQLFYEFALKHYPVENPHAIMGIIMKSNPNIRNEYLSPGEGVKLPDIDNMTPLQRWYHLGHLW